MTNKERLVDMLGFAASNNAIDAALIDANVTSSATYDGTAYPSLILAKISLLRILLSTPNSSNPESGMHTTYDRAAIQKEIDILRNEAGIGTTTGNKVTFINPW